MKPGTFLTLLIITVIFAGVNPIAAAPDREVVGLTGTKWDVFVLEFPLCRDACGGATITFYEEGEGIIEWNDPGVEGLPFSCRVKRMSLSGLLVFTLDEGGWGVAQMDTGIIMILSGAYHGRINYIIMGVPRTCAEEGELFSFVYSEYPQHCCRGLTEWHSGFDARISIDETCYETGLAKGAPVGRCINCGNEVCEGQESVCNCEQDCDSGINSDFGTIDEFCRSERWEEMIHVCEEQPGMEDLPLCALCE
jgi:hypothetical protein